jgi:2-methylisocitrate lyase-like PEP mutase family enzyme
MTFPELHQGTSPLLLPNAWDVPSALAFADAGFPAVGTTSFGVAASHGSPDGQRASRAANLDLVRALRALPVYLSVDIEDGYDEKPADVADYVAELAEAGAAGVNIEDSTAESLIPSDRHAAKVEAIKNRCPELFVNARVDTYWLDQDASPDATLARAEAYVAAGADGVFVPGATDPAVLRAITSNLPVPVNTLVVPGMSLTQLGELGVRRVSTGSLPYRAAIRAAVAVAESTRDNGTAPDAIPYPVLQAQLTKFVTARCDPAGRYQLDPST